MINDSKIIDFEEIILTDYWGFIIDVDLEGYFDTVLSQYDKIDHSKLDSS